MGTPVAWPVDEDGSVSGNKDGGDVRRDGFEGCSTASGAKLVQYGWNLPLSGDELAREAFKTNSNRDGHEDGKWWKRSLYYKKIPEIW